MTIVSPMATGHSNLSTLSVLEEGINGPNIFLDLAEKTTIYPPAFSSSQSATYASTKTFVSTSPTRAQSSTP